MDDIKYTTAGMDLLPDGWEWTGNVGLRLTPGCCAAYCELSQYGDEHTELTVSQMRQLRDMLTEELENIRHNC